MKYKTLEELKKCAEVLNRICLLLDQEADVNVKAAISEATLGGLGGVGGLGGGLAAIYFLGVTGFSGPGIVSGLAAIGAFLGGGMLVGIGVVAATPWLLSGGGSKVGKWLDHKKFEGERSKLSKIAQAQLQVLVSLCDKPGLGSALDKYRRALTELREEISRLG